MAYSPASTIDDHEYDSKYLAQSQPPVLGAKEPPIKLQEVPGKNRPYLFDSFMVAGTDLNLYEPGMEKPVTADSAPPFELFEDFDIASQVEGGETWRYLVYDIRRYMQKPTFAFYVDKVAMKRWLPTFGILVPESFVLAYQSELTSSGKVEDETVALFNILPGKGTDYCAKPTHTSYSDGVWLVKNEIRNGKRTRYVSIRGHGFHKRGLDHVTGLVATGLAMSLHEPPRYFESWALKNVKPGVVIEERFTSFDRDDRPAVEFKVFCVWGRVVVSTWKQGTETYGYFRRDGTKIKTYENDFVDIPRPSWVDWEAVVELAEKLAANKDMFRVDIFAGRPVGRAGVQEKKAKVVVSECEIFPTTQFEDERIHEEVARLWVAGYKIGNYCLVPNTQVPSAYLKSGVLSEADTKMLSSASET